MGTESIDRLVQARAKDSDAVMVVAAAAGTSSPIVDGGYGLERGDDNRLRRNGTVCGVIVDPSTPRGIDKGTAAMGSTDWVVALPPKTTPIDSSPSRSATTDPSTSSSSNDDDDDNSSWNMIPAENLIVAARDTGTKIAFSLLREGDAAGLEGALELGVDALCVPLDADNGVWDAALRAVVERDAKIQNDNDGGGDGGETTTTTAAAGATVPRVVSGSCWRGDTSSSSSAAVRADRVCIDLVQTLQPTEGCWIGSSAKLMALVLSEAAVSSLVPSRPFRVNAGPVHSYVLMGDGVTTKYLSELGAGEEVLVYDSVTGLGRGVAIGRLKVEVRPCVMVGLRVVVEEEEGVGGGGGGDGQIFLQQAETVRLGQRDGGFVRVTDLQTQKDSDDDDNVSKMIDHNVLLRTVGTGTHIGKAYSGKVLER